MSSSIDVIVPCYRYAHLLRDCVASVLDQREVDVRVLVIDDASPDDTENVARLLMEKDSRVEYRRHAENRGHIATYNEGIEWLAADYAVLLSADDMLTPGSLRRATHFLDENPHVGFVWGRAITIRNDEVHVERAIDADFPCHVQRGDEFLREACDTGDNVVLTPTVIVRTSLQKKFGGYRPHLTHAGDFEMWMRFAAHGDVGFIDGAQAFYRVHGQNMSGDYSLLRDLEQRRLAFDELFANHAGSISGAAKLRRTAMRSLATTAFWAGSHAFDREELESNRTFLEFAERVDPSIRRTGMWRRFALKRAFGSSIWRAVRPVVLRLKGKTA